MAQDDRRVFQAALTNVVFCNSSLHVVCLGTCTHMRLIHGFCYPLHAYIHACIHTYMHACRHASITVSHAYVYVYKENVHGVNEEPFQMLISGPKVHMFGAPVSTCGRTGSGLAERAVYIRIRTAASWCSCARPGC